MKKLKKLLSVLLVALIVVFSLSGCIRIVLNDDPSGATESQKEAKYYTYKDFVGVWVSPELSSRLCLREDMTCYYVELAHPNLYRVLGAEGDWTYSNDGTVAFSVELVGEIYYVLGVVQEDGTLPMKNTTDRSNSYADRTFTKSEKWTEADVDYQVGYEVDVRHGVVRELNDGLYHSFNTDEEAALEDETMAAFSYAYVEGELLTIEGRLGQYDENWHDNVLPGTTYRLLLATDCVFVAAGGDTEQIVDAKYLNEVFYEQVSHLGLAIQMKDGLVVRVEIQS